ncbi:MAG: aminopeptidase [Candidatus Woesearchaeota archaeon]|nr:MAG: aminopeptidase [Candidatus Woesearchaeota archaeon]
MVDERIKKIAKILVDYSIKVKPNSRIMVRFTSEANPLALEIYKLILKNGAFPVMRPNLQGYAYAYYTLANKKQLNTYPIIEDFIIKNTDGHIYLGGDFNTQELTSIDPKKMSLRSKLTKPIFDARIKKNNWVLFEYPTNALAQDAEMSLEEFENFVFSACIQDWKKEGKKQDAIKKIVDKGKNVRIIGEDTDISFSIRGRIGRKCDGHYNMPDGEVFTSPVENSTEGKIAYSFPARYGKVVDGVRLEFKKGKVVKATADKNEDYLKKMLNTDSGAKILGEWGIGLNYNIKKFVKQILFDEKIGGTIHLALGHAYKEVGGKNDSAIHWDMIKDLRKKGEVLVDDKVFMKKGKVQLKNF